MDTRTVLACAPVAFPDQRAHHSDTELLSWFTGERSRHEIRLERTPLDEAHGWERGAWSVERADGRYFRVVSVAVEAGSREVANWTQPLFEPNGLGIAAFLTRRIDGVPHLLAHARLEGGFLDTVEIGPTVQCVPENHAPPGSPDRPPFLDLVLEPKPERIRYEAVHSEEGGRFLNAESRYLVVDVDDHADFPPGGSVGSELPPGYCWLTPGQLGSLTRHGRYVNVQARTLLACLTAQAVAW